MTLRSSFICAALFAWGIAAWSPAVAGPGSGTAIVTPSAPVPAGSNDTWSIQYTAEEAMANGLVRITIPAGWTAPQSLGSSSAGYVTVSTNEPSGNPVVSTGGQVITVDIDALSVGNTVTVVYGDDAGGSSARATAETVPASYQFVVASDPSGTSTAPIAASPSLTVIPGPPASLEIAPSDTTVTAGAFADYRLIARDEFGNRAPVPSSRTVLLFPGHGSFYAPSNHSTPITQIPIAAGKTSAPIDYRGTLATASGSPHTIFVFTQSGSPTLAGNDQVSIVPAALSTTQSTISATTPVTANGTSQSSVTVTSKDAFGNLREGDAVTIDATGSALDVDPSDTDENGEALGVVTNTVAENVTVSAAINTQAITATAPVAFVAGAVSASTSVVTATTPIVANGIASSTITVTARDANGNLIAGQTVTLSVSPPGGGAVLTQPGGVTNALGVATGALASTTTGSRTVSAMIGATSVTDNAVVSFTAGPVASFVWSVDGAGVAGAFELVTLTAKDAQGHTITDYTGTVNLSTNSTGVGDAVVQWSAPAAFGVITNLSGDDATYQFAAGDNGVAALRITDTKAETIILSVSAGAVSGNSSSIVVAPGAPDEVQLVAGDGQTATVNTPVTTPPKVKVVDAFDNAITGATVTFSVLAGGGFRDVTAGGSADATGVTASDGTIDCDVWRMGNLVTGNPNQLHAQIAAGSIPSVDFTATATAGPGAALVLTPGTKNVTVGSNEQVTASLTDSFGNPKSGEMVTVVIKTGLFGTLVEDPLDPGTTAALNPQARQGLTDATGKITVRYVAPLGAGLADVLDASTPNVAQSDVTDVTYTSDASGATNLRITFVSSSTQPAGGIAQFTIEAVDGNGNRDTSNNSLVNFVPEGGSGLVFSDQSDMTPVVTNTTLSSGVDQIWVRGTVAGPWTITASTGGGIGSEIVTLTVTDTGVIDEYSVSTVPSVVAGVSFNVAVTALDQYDNLVDGANNSITLAAIDDVTTNPLTPNLTVTGASLSAGQATVGTSYTKADAIRVRVTGAGEEGISGILTVTAAAAKRITKVSGDGTGVAVATNRNLTVRVLDTYDNPVTSQQVTFLVLQGGGTVLPLNVSTGGTGDATTVLTTGAVAGDNRVRASILDGTPPIDEQVEFSVVTVAGVITHYTVVPQKTSLTAGEVVPLVITGYDAGNNVVSSDNTSQVQLSSSGNAQFGAVTGTLTAGVFNTTVTDTLVQNFTVTAQKLGGGPPTGTSASISVANAGTYRVAKGSGDGSVTAGATRVLQAIVRDQFFNLVPNALVTFSVALAPDGTGFFTDTSGDPNDGIAVANGSGVAQVTYTTAQTAGANQINAQILDGAPVSRERVTFTVNTVAGGIEYYVVAMNSTTVIANQANLATVTAYDDNDNPVDNDVTQVTLVGAPGIGLVFATNPLTLNNGVASTNVTANLVQQYRVRASTVGNPSITGLGPLVDVGPAAPAGAGTITATATQNTITANGTSTTTITSGVIRDAFTNQVAPGLTVNVAATNGGFIVGGPAKTIGADGRIVFDLRSSNTAGPSTVTMTSATGNATGQIIITFAPKPAFAANNPTPAIVVPGSSVAFSVQVNNTTTTSVDLTTATTFTFTDGTRTYSATLAAPQTIAGNATLVFNAATVNAAFTTASYSPNVNLIGTDEFLSPVNVVVSLPAASLIVSSIQMTGIVPEFGVVSRGQTFDVAVTVKNDGAQSTVIDDVDLVFIPAGLFNVGNAPELGQSVGPGASKVFNVPVTVQVGATIQSYQIDAVTTGTVGGQTVTDNAIAPFPLGNIQVTAAANLAYQSGTLSPTTVSRGDPYSFQVTIRNDGGGLVLLDSAQTNITFTDGTRTYTGKPVQNYAIAGGGATQQITFRSRFVPAAFTPGPYPATFNAGGTENGSPFSQAVALTSVLVQTPALVTNVAGNALSPDQVTKTTTAIFTVQLQTSGASVVLTPATTTIRFSGSQYTAALNLTGPTTLAPGITTLQFLGATVSAAIPPGNYNPTVQLTGFENGNAFSQSIVLTDGVAVQNAPSIAILNMLSSQTQFTQDQTKPIKVRMIVSNSNGADVTFTAASMRFIHGGVDRTGQFVISTPSTFQGGALLSSGEVDTVLFNVSDNTGNPMSVGNMTIEGDLEVEEVNTSEAVFADTDLGGKGNLQVMTPAAITFDAVIPSQTVITQSMARDIKVRAVVRNTGGSDVVLALANPTTRLNFTPSPGWVVTSPATLAGGGSTLTGGELDTLIFNVTTSGSTPDPATTVSVTTTGTESNSGRGFTQTSALATLLVQTPGSIQVVSVVPSQTSITQDTTPSWTITVTLTNVGESDVNLALGNNVSLSIQNQTVPPSFTIPAVLAGGGTLLSGGETDQLVIPLTTAGTYASIGVKNITVDVDGTELNSGVTRTDAGTGSVLVQQKPNASFVSLTPGTVSRLTNVAFAVTVSNPTAPNRATMTLDRNLSRLRFGSNQYNVGLAPASPVDIATGAQAILQFTGAIVSAGVPTGVQADAELDLHWTHNGVPDGEKIPIPTAITVQNAPSLSIVSVRPSRPTMTRDQLNAGTVTMVVQNSGGANVDLDLGAATTRLGFKVLSNGATVTSEYGVAQPTELEAAGGTVLAGGATDSLVFDVTQAGTTTGSIIVNGFVGGIDLNSSLPVTDDTFDGGSGSLALQLAGALSILAITPSQPTATTGQNTKSYTVDMTVRNTGGAAIDVTLPQASSDIQFVGTSGFVHSDAAMPNGVTLAGGETDILRFTVTTTGTPAGLTTITGNVSGVETNTGLTRTDDTTSGGTGSILLQTPAVLVVDSVTPSQPSVTASSSSPWNTTVVLHNSGESDAQLNLPAGFTINVQSSPGTTFASPFDLEEGGAILAGGASGTLVATTPTTGSFSTLGSRAINVTVGATEVNSNRAFSAPGAGSVIAQLQPNLTVLAVRPAIVTSASVVDFEVDVRNTDPDAATARINRGATRVHFASQAFSAFLDVTSADSVEAGQTVTLRFEAKIIPASIAVGPYDFNVNLAYTHNQIARTEPEVVTNGVAVQAAPQLAIQQIVTSQPSVTAGQDTDWTATMTVVNNGAADIDLDLAAAKTRLTFIAPGGSPDNSYTVSAGVVGAGEDTLSTSETANVVFTITQTGTQTGNIVISGRVEGRDLNQLAIVTDDTFDGGRGGVVVQSAPGVSVMATHTSQPQVTVGQTGWSVRVVVANTGGSDVTIGAASIAVAGGGWTFGPPTLMGGGNVLEGGVVDSLLFTATAGPGNAGTRRIDATVPWTEINTSNNGSANTTTSGFGSIVVESPASLQVTTTAVSAPNPASVNVNQAFNITVQIQNTGGADARNVVVGMTTDSASSIQTVAPLAVVPAGQTVAYDLPVIAAAVADPSETFTTTLSSAIDENSGQQTLVTLNNPPADATATLAVETVAALDITNVRPSQPSVTRGQSIPWNVIVRIQNTGQSDAVLTTPAAGNLGFSLAGSTKIDYVVQPPAQFGSGTAGWTLPGGATDSLIYRIVTTGSDPGTVDIAAAVAGTDRNEPPRTLSDTGATTVMVQDLAGVFLAATVPVGTFNHASAARDTVNTSFAYEIHVTVQNSGGEGVDSVLVSLATDGASIVAPVSNVRRSIAAAGNHEFVFRITSAVNPDALETFIASILPGVKSANSGQTVIPQQAVDRTHQVVIQRPADLVMNLYVASPPGSVNGVVSPGQQFTLAARVSQASLPRANVSGPAQLTLAVPAGFDVAGSLVRSFALDDTVSWAVTAPAVQQSALDFSSTITTTPNDVNMAAAAFASKPVDIQSVTVSTGGALASPTLFVSSPAGAADDTLSVLQTVNLRATVITTDDTRQVTSTLTVPAGFSIINSAVRNLGNGPGIKQVDYQINAPGSAVSGADVLVTFTAVDVNSGDPVPSAEDTLSFTVVPRTTLAVSAAVTAPADAIDKAVAIGTPFWVSATVSNAAGAADIEAPGSLQITLPPLYSLAAGHTAQKPFVVGMAVEWEVNAASQPSGPDQIAVNIVNIPNDENSGIPAQITTGTSTIAMVTEGAAVSVRDVSSALGVETGVAPGGAKDLDVLGFEIAYNVTDTSVDPAEVDTLALTIIDKDGNPLSNGMVAQTLARLSVDIGGATPYEVSNPNTNPVIVSLVASPASDRDIAPDGSINAIVSLDLDASPRAGEIRVRLSGGGMIVKDPQSGPLDVTDTAGRPLDGQITSGPLVVLSSNFEEYAHNAPNPFRAGSSPTQISYFLDAPSNVTIRIFDITGELVFEESIPSSDPRAQSGPQETPWDGRNMKGEVVRNGVYVCVLNAGAKSAKIRIAVAK